MESAEQNRSTPENKKAKQIVLGLVFAAFGIIFLQQITHFYKQEKNDKLDGDIVPSESPSFSLGNWWDGNFQEQSNNYLNENFGFRNLLVRMNNQILYSLFRRTNTKEVIIGKDNNFFIEGYVNALNSVEYIGEDAINDTLEGLKFIQNKLSEIDKTFLVILAPSKARIYKEFLPDDYLPKEQRRTNYDAYVEGMKRMGINFLDFNAIYSAKKGKTKYPLFPQTGAHWSRLEAVIAADTILKYLSYLSKNDLPEIVIDKIEEKDYLEPPDDDIVKGMNLMFTPQTVKMGYPEYHIKTTNKVKKSALVIGDSFWWDIFLRKIPRKVFKTNEFWYYCRDAYGSTILGNKPVSGLDWKRRILQNDLVIIVCAESNYGRLGFGFVGNAVNALKKEISPTQEELSAIKENITTDAAWMEQIRKKAAERKLSVDSLLNETALWSFKYFGPPLKKITLEDVIKSIKDNQEWYNGLKNRAKNENVPFDTLLKKDATWFYNTMVEEENEGLSLPKIIELIKNTPDWMKQIREKAARKNISVDSMIVLDAIWYRDNH